MMLRTFALTLCVLAALSSAAPAQSTAEHAIDTAKSHAQFSISHVFVGHVTGAIPIASGSVEMRPGSSIPLKATAVLDAAKFDTGDQDRDATMTGPNYFDAKSFPTWTFTSTKIIETGPASFTMDGNLTLHGVTQPEHLDVTVGGDATHPVYHATGHIDRRSWGMKGTRLDPAIGGVADVTLDVVLGR
ncbi:YceI family protein [bacterium]|nr:MAG: YceI family protein [bacterium]